MRGMLIVVFFALVGYYAYQHYSYEPPPPPPPPPAPKVEPLDFFIKVRVRALFEDWKRRHSRGPQGPQSAPVDAAQQLADIRRRLISNKKHAESALSEAVASGLRELGLPEDEVAAVCQDILSQNQRSSSGSGRKLVIPANAEFPSSGKRSVGGGW